MYLQVASPKPVQFAPLSRLAEWWPAALLGIAEMGSDPVNHAKYGVKILVVVVIAFLAWPRRRAASVQSSTYHAIGLLAIANVAIAVFWK